MPIEQLINALQSQGVRLADPSAGCNSRRGGAGPSDHKAVTSAGQTVMVPVHTAPAFESPFVIGEPDAAGHARLRRKDAVVGDIDLAAIDLPRRPRFYDLETSDGVPLWKIATLHGRDVLATTVLQSCIRYQSRTKSCQFCAIGQSLAAGRTIERKTPAQLAEVARAAVELDGVKHMVMTTGTPPGDDRGAAMLAESAAAVKAAVDLPIQAQCEPPGDWGWFARLQAAGVDTLGMHLEVLDPDLRRRIMPGKAQIAIDTYYAAFEEAVAVFGRGQVSTYILAGLGDTIETILAHCARLVGLGVYPFVVPFVPISGTPLESHPTPDAAFMDAILAPLARLIAENGLGADKIKAGCGKCGACSALASYERRLTA